MFNKFVNEPELAEAPYVKPSDAGASPFLLERKDYAVVKTIQQQASDTAPPPGLPKLDLISSEDDDDAVSKCGGDDLIRIQTNAAMEEVDRMCLDDKTRRLVNKIAREIPDGPEDVEACLENLNELGEKYGQDPKFMKAVELLREVSCKHGLEFPFILNQDGSFTFNKPEKGEATFNSGKCGVTPW